MRKKITFIFFCLISFTKNSKADTIDFCTVYLNKIEIASYNQNIFGKTLILNLNDLKQNDSIKIIYYRDSPCDECVSSIQIRDIDSTNVLLKQGIGTSTPISFRVHDLTEYSRRTNTKIFNIYHTENPYFPNITLVFRIQIQ